MVSPDEPQLSALDPAARAELDQRARGFVRTLSALDPNSPRFHEMAAQLGEIGRDAAAELARMSAQHLDRVAAAASHERVLEVVAGLHKIMGELDPSRSGHLLGVRRVLGLAVGRARPEDYFARFAAARAPIEAALASLARSRNDLLAETITIKAMRADLRESTERLGTAVETARLLGARLQAAAREIASPALGELAAVTIGEREADLSTQLALGVQADAALALVASNATTLGALADKALAATMAVLRTAIAAARALAQQDLVFRQLDAIRTAATNLIEAPVDEAPDASIEALQRAFAGLHAAMDEAAGFGQSAQAELSTSLAGLT